MNTTFHHMKILQLTCKAIVITWLALALAACGGGGGGGGGGGDQTSTSTPTPTPPENTKSVSVACEGCSAQSATQFAPTGKIGVWEFDASASQSTETVSVDIDGFNGQQVTLLLTNTSNREIDISENLGLLVRPAGDKAQSMQPYQAPIKAYNQTPSSISEFNTRDWKKFIPTPDSRKTQRQTIQALITRPIPSLGSTKTWKDCRSVYAELCGTDVDRNTTLMAQQATQSGIIVNVWVQNDEIGPSKVSLQMAENLATAYASQNGIYDAMVDFKGPPWGDHDQPGVLIPDSGMIDIVLLNLTPDSHPFGLVGYFFGANNYSTQILPTSNEAVAVFLDTESLHLSSTGLSFIKSALVHEATHMRNFYQRVVVNQDIDFPLWLEEFTALAAEDILSDRLDPTFNTLTEYSLPYFIALNNQSCNFKRFEFTSTMCDPYATNATLAGFLIRQLGVPLYKALLNVSTGDPETAMNTAIKSIVPSSDLNDQLIKLSRTMAALAEPSRHPNGMGMPSLLSSDGYSIPGIDLSRFRELIPPSNTSPPTIAPNSSVFYHSGETQGKFTKRVQVPAGLRFSVIAH
jgi:hypothetical protein